MKLNKNIIIMLLLGVIVTSTGYQYSQANSQEIETDNWEEEINWDQLDNEDIQWLDEEGNEISPDEFDSLPPYSFEDEKDFLTEWIDATLDFLNEVQSEGEQNLSQEILLANRLKEKIQASQSEAILNNLETEMDQLEASLDKLFPPMTIEEEKTFAQEWIDDLKSFLTEENLSEFDIDSNSLLGKLNQADSKLAQYLSEDNYDLIDGIYTTLDEVENDLSVVFDSYETTELDDAKSELMDWISYIRIFINEAKQEGISVADYESDLQWIEGQIAGLNNWDQMDELFSHLEKLDQKLEQAY